MDLIAAVLGLLFLSFYIGLSFALIISFIISFFSDIDRTELLTYSISLFLFFSILIGNFLDFNIFFFIRDLYENSVRNFTWSLQSNIYNPLIYCIAGLYPFMNEILERIKTRLFPMKKLSNILKTIKFIYLLIFVYVITLFIFTDFSIFSGWEYISTYKGNPNAIAVLVFIFGPIYLLLVSFAYSYVILRDYKN